MARLALDCEVWQVKEQKKIAEFRCHGDPESPADLRQHLVDAVVTRGGYPPARLAEFEMRITETLTRKKHLPHVTREDDRAK